MPDTYTLRFRNFRSIRDATVEIAPLTVIYGANGSGKSSLIYGLLTLKNFLTNPGQNVASLFSYPSISLGGLREVVHGHSSDRSLSLAITVSNPDEVASAFSLKLDQSGGSAGFTFAAPEGTTLRPNWAGLDLEIALPYGGEQQVERRIAIADVAGDKPVATLNWNGITASPQLWDGAQEHEPDMAKLFTRFNLPMELARQTGFVPLRRGFSKTSYGLASVTPALATEDEVASLLASPDERFRQYEISRYVERIAQRRVQTQAQIGTSAFTIDTIPTGEGFPASIVNEGFGVNQLLYLLTICLHSPFKIVAIEEPEIHLHPSMVRELARAMVDIVAKEDRRLIVSTHSETFVVALLAQLATGKLDADNVSFLLAENRGGLSTFTRQKATADGQIEGGLEAFMASEINDLAMLLGIDDQREP